MTWNKYTTRICRNSTTDQSSAGTMDKEFQTRWRQADAQLKNMYESNSAQVQQRAVRQQRSELEHQQLHIANEQRLHLEAQTPRMSQNMEHQTLSIPHQKEQQTQRLRDQSERHEQWLQNPPDQRTNLEPAFILGDRKLQTESVNAIESVLQTELVVALPKSMPDACMRHGYCTAEPIIGTSRSSSYCYLISMMSG